MNIDKKNHSEKPWYKRYPAEMMLATQRLTFAQRGIYWTIQDHLWFEIHEGGLDEEYIKDICKDAEDSDVYKVLQLFFKKDGDLYYSKHLRNQYQDIIQKSENARKGWEAKKKAQSENTDDSITEKAEREQEFEKKRESKEAKEEYQLVEEQLKQYKLTKQKEIELIRTLPPELNEFYREKVGEYMNY